MIGSRCSPEYEGWDFDNDCPLPAPRVGRDDPTDALVWDVASSSDDAPQLLFGPDCSDDSDATGYTGEEADAA